MTDFLLAVFGNIRSCTNWGQRNLPRCVLRRLQNKKWTSPRSIQKLIRGTKTMFSFAYKSELIEREPNYGHDFDAPAKREFKKYQATGGKKLFTCDEIRQLLTGGWGEGQHSEKSSRKDTGEHDSGDECWTHGERLIPFFLYGLQMPGDFLFPA
jgi:hypothetical protein